MKYQCFLQMKPQMIKTLKKLNPYSYIFKLSGAKKNEVKIFWAISGTIGWVFPPAPYIYIIIIGIKNKNK